MVAGRTDHLRAGEFTSAENLIFVGTGTDSIETRINALRLCVHCVKLVHGRTHDRPFGEVDRLAQWCTENIGPRHVDWTYRSNGTWCFREQEDSMRFWLTWC